MRYEDLLLRVAMASFLALTFSGKARASTLEETCKEAFHASVADLDNISLEITGTDPNLTLTATSGNITRQMTCTLCSHDELKTTATLLGTSMRAAVAGLPVGGVLMPSLSPGIHLRVDRMRISEEFDHIPLPPGPHLFELTDGHSRASATVTTNPATLRALQIDDFEIDLAVRPLFRAAIISGGLGLGATAVGIALIAIDGNCGEVSDGVCQANHNTLPAGVALLSLGVAAVTTGVALAITAAVRKRRMTGWIQKEAAP